MTPRAALRAFAGPTSWGAEIDVVEWYGNKFGRSMLSSDFELPEAAASRA